MKIEKVTVLGYVDDESLGREWREWKSWCCYWCGRREDEVGLRPFKMKLGRDVFVNLTCNECFKEYSELGRLMKKGKQFERKQGGENV